MKQSNNRKTKDVTAFLYERLSRDDNLEGESYSIGNQKKLLTKVAKEKGYTYLVHFLDDGISGVTMDRPGFQDMIHQLEQGKASAVFVKDLSRLGRNYIEVGRLTEEFFPEHDIRLVAVSDNIDTNEGENELAPIRNLFNEWYEWLMCMDDFKTEGERIHSICSQSIERDEIINRLIELHGYKVALEKIFTSEVKDTEEDQLEADKQALAEWSGSSCHLRYPPGISDEDALNRIHNTYPEPIIRITSPVSPIACRFIEQCEYLRIVKDIDDYIEMRMSFLFRKHVDGATGYSGR